MKNISSVLSGLSLVGVIALFVMHFSSTKKNSAPVAGNTTVATTPAANTCKIAYVNIDSLETHYELLKTKREEFKRRQSQMESELQRSAAQMQTDVAEVQKKIQANTITQSEYEAAQKRVGQMQQSLEYRKQSMTEQLMKDQDDFNKEMRGKLDAILEEYNKGKQYDYILSYTSAGTSVLLVNKAYDITKEVIDAMNAKSKK